MLLAELLLPEFDEEMTATRRVLERVPDGKASWKPHPKSMTLGRLATLVAELPAWAVNALTLDELDIMPSGGPPPKFEALGSTKQILDVFDRNAKAARAALVKTPDAEFKDRKSTRLNSSHLVISYAVFCLKKKKKQTRVTHCEVVKSEC